MISAELAKELNDAGLLWETSGSDWTFPRLDQLLQEILNQGYSSEIELRSGHAMIWCEPEKGRRCRHSFSIAATSIEEAAAQILLRILKEVSE